MNDPNPLVSTITACYKKEKFLSTFLSELPNQTIFNNIEIVFDHNEPTPRELDLIKKFQTEYEGSISHQIIAKVDPLGISWNRCIKNSKGLFLTIWNIDDLRTNNSLELQANSLIDNKDIDVVAGDYYHVKSFLSTDGKLFDSSKIQPIDFKRKMELGPFFMFRKKILEKTGYFDEQFFCANDFDLAIRLAIHGKIFWINKNLGYFLNEGTGLSTSLNTICPVERTVIQLRYGMYDLVDYHFLPKAMKYNIYNLKYENRWIPVSNFIPDYENILNVQYKKRYEQGIKNNYKMNLRRKLESYIKKIIRR